jgi:signal transduction histidine kinase
VSGVRRAIVALAVAGFVLGLAALAIVLTSDHENAGTTFVVVALVLGWGFMGAGLFAWWQRPEHRIGPLMTLVGFTWFAGAGGSSDNGWLFTLGAAVSSLWIGALVHLLVAYPSGRVAPGLERWLVRLGWVVSLSPVPALFVTAQLDTECGNCPPNELLIRDVPTVSDIIVGVWSAAAAGLLLGVAVVLVRRWRAFGPVQRRALAPVLWTGAAVAAGGVATLAAQAVGAGRIADLLDGILLVLVAAVPFAFLLGLLRSRLSRAGAVSALVERFGGIGVRDALAEALGDRTLTLAYWLPEPGHYVDADGHPVELPGAGDARAATEIERGGAKLAAIVHDRALCEEPELVAAAGAAAALALENDRLDAELRARYTELRAAGARLVAAGDAARRRIERDLHDGAQQRFVALGLTLRLARSRLPDDSEAAVLLDGGLSELNAGLAELRELARGIHPAVLSERGLEPALASLAARAPVPATITANTGGRLPPAVETAAYFIVAEALTNVAKYASASAAEVTLRREDGHVLIDVRDDGVGGADPRAGTGLRGIEDRIAALDGHLRIESPPGRGTLLRAEIPCRPEG